MSGAAWLQVLAVIALLAISTPILGSYMAKVYGDGKAPGDRFFGPIERVIYRVCGVDPETEQRWSTYAISLLAFSLVSVVILYAQLRLQGHLPFNPDHRTGVTPALSLNTAVSFLTNTNWQNYSGESTMSHLTQMAGLALHNFVSAAVGAAVAVALDPRPRPPAHPHARQLLGRPRAHHHADPRSAGDRLHARAREPGLRPELPRRAHGHDGHGSEADDPRRSDREPGGDQGDRRERRRPVQRQLLAPVREPEPDHQHAPDLDAARDPVRVPMDVREDGGQRETRHRGARARCSCSGSRSR